MNDLRFYWSLLLRRLPVMLALFLVFTLLGVVTAIRAPATYSTSAQLLIESPQISAETAGAANAGGAETLQVVEQQLMTRANLIDIANKFNVFPNPALTPDEKVTRMRAATQIRRASGRDQASMMTVRFTGDSPKVVADVVNEYVTLILAGNTRTRVGRAEEQLRFYEQEVERLNTDLQAQTAKIMAFKRENADALPENLQYRQGRQALLQERVSRLQTDIAALQTQRADMLRIFEETGSVSGNGSPDEQQLDRLRQRLAQLEAISQTGDNPRIRGLRAQIAAMEKSLQPAGEGEGEGQTGNALLDLNLSQIDSRIQTAQTEIEQATRELETLEASVRKTSDNALELAALERDQANIQSRYNAAVASLAQARTVERIETSARGERITVVEGASVPSQPSGPDRKKIAALGSGVGLGLAVAFFALMEILNSTIRRPSELKARFQVTPLAVIPYIETRRERRKRLGWRLMLVLAVAVTIPLALWYLHINYMPLDILTMKVLARLGLG